MIILKEFKNAPQGLVDMWDKVYKNAKEQYGDDQRAAQTAWAVVKKKYKKSSDGQWVKKESLEILSDKLIESIK